MTTTVESGNRPMYPSVTRIADIEEVPYQVAPLQREMWSSGQYVMFEVTDENETRSYEMERADGRSAQVFVGDKVIGALGKRAATLQAVGDWEVADGPADLALLNIAGVAGRLLSRSPFASAVPPVHYIGHLTRAGRPLAMGDFVDQASTAHLSTPVVLIIGTSMSAGKTTAAARIIRTLNRRQHRVVGVKLTGVGRYRDILAMSDAGAEWIVDFVDAGLPSTVVPPDEFTAAAQRVFAMIEGLDADVAVVEAGASPLEPYNGDLAVALLGECVRTIVLCASDPYAALGVMQSFAVTPTFVTGRATSTDAGTELTQRLTGCLALNLLDVSDWSHLDKLLDSSLGPETG